MISSGYDLEAIGTHERRARDLPPLRARALSADGGAEMGAAMIYRLASRERSSEPNRYGYRLASSHRGPEANRYG